MLIMHDFTVTGCLTVLFQLASYLQLQKYVLLFLQLYHRITNVLRQKSAVQFHSLHKIVKKNIFMGSKLSDGSNQFNAQHLCKLASKDWLPAHMFMSVVFVYLLFTDTPHVSSLGVSHVPSNSFVHQFIQLQSIIESFSTKIVCS